MNGEQNMQKNEEEILFHTLGYDYNPRWNDDRGGYRNYFCTTINNNNNDYVTIQKLVKDGYMKFESLEFANGQIYSATQKGIDYVVDLWKKKKKKNKPTRSKRRYQAYRDWCDWDNGSFREFLNWLKITKNKRLFCTEEVECIE